MEIKSLSTFLKKEELQLPAAECQEITDQSSTIHPKEKSTDDVGMDEFMVMRYNVDMDDDDEENIQEGPKINYWECLMPYDQDGYGYLEDSWCMSCFQEGSMKKEPEYTFWEDDDDDDYDEKKMSLNLSLNYQEVLDAWSDRTLWADDSLFPTAPNNAYMGEVEPTIEEGRKQRQARVLRYKEKRQTRLFSKKIRYQVRKLNADKRPRLKGRFVKRVAEKIHK